MRIALLLLVLLIGCAHVDTPRPVSFSTSDGGLIHADLYGKGRHGVVLVHGGRFTKESWREQARTLASAGMRVLAIDLRGRGLSRGGATSEPPDAAYRHDVLGAVRYLRRQGSDRVSIIGASLGGGAAAEASTDAADGEIDALILLAPAAIEEPEKMKGRKLFIVSRDDVMGENRVPRLPRIRAQFDRVPAPKELLVVEGSAHAQLMFESAERKRLMREILRFLSEGS